MLKAARATTVSVFCVTAGVDVPRPRLSRRCILFIEANRKKKRVVGLPIRENIRDLVFILVYTKIWTK